MLPEDVDCRGKTKTTNMSGGLHFWLVEHMFAGWRRKCFGDDKLVHLIQDLERCLWLDFDIRALAASGCRVVQQFPKSSPDLNAIEGWWHRLRQRLEDTAPRTMESRPDLLVWLRRTAHWMNDHCRADALHLATNQKERANQVVGPELGGANTRW